jgi:TatA/E family protein of Tat protein translocase
MPFGITELLVILAAIILIFGSRLIPGLAIGMGRAIKEFRKHLHDECSLSKEELKGRK